jgi:hypothetical protein
LFRSGAQNAGATALFQGLDQEEDFGGHRVVEIRGVREGVFTAAGDDGLVGAEVGLERNVGVGPGGELLKKGSGFDPVVGEAGSRRG